MDMRKVFLSYSRKDETFVEQLYQRLTRDGIEVFYDKESIEWGANWVRELERGIDECDDVIVVLTPDFCQSKWTEFERTSAMADDPSGLKRKIRPLVLTPCKHLASFPRFLKPIQRSIERVYIDICLYCL